MPGTNTKLKLFVDPSWRRQGIHSPLMNPWWGNPNPESSLFAKEMFDAHQFDTSAYEVTQELAGADMVFAPYRHGWMLKYDPLLLRECARVAGAAELPLLIDGVSDVEYPVNISNAYVLRIGGYRFVPEEGRIQLPPSVDDLLERCCNGQLQIRKKGIGLPIVGFAGWAHLTPVQRLRNFVKELPMRMRGLFDRRYRAMQKGVLWREYALWVLKGSSQVALNVRERASFSASAKTAQGDLRILRQEMVDTLLKSDYGLDVRGDANDSGRLFEILSLARIPVILDTERRLPFSDELDYKEFCLVVDFRDIVKLPERIAEFHTQVTPERFEAMQLRAREVFVNYFRIDAQMRHIVAEIRKLQ